MNGFFDYFLRCRQADRPALMALAWQLGVLRDDAGTPVAAQPQWVWVPIGAICAPGTQQPLLAPDGQPWWHANLRMTVDLRQHAEAVCAAQPSPELAAALADIARFFIVDAEGRAARPVLPAFDFV